MPEFLKDYLFSLDMEQRDQLWLWLDGDPDAISSMIELVAFEEKSCLHLTKQ